MLRFVVIGGALGACWRGGDTPKPAAPATTVTAPSAPAARPGEVLTADRVLARISSTYNGQVRRCYETFIKRNGTTEGKVTLSFTVDPTGHVINPHAEGMAPEITGCIARLMTSWYFAPPPRNSAEATFRIPLRLVAN